MVAYLLLCRPFRAKIEAFTVTLSEIAIAVLFTLNIGFFFDISRTKSIKLEEISTVFLFTGVFIPSISGFFSLFLKIREAVERYRRVKYAVQGDYWRRNVVFGTNSNERQATPLAY